MPSFLYTATHGGAREVGRVEAASLAAARHVLEERGFADVVFHTDAMDDAYQRTMFASAEQFAATPEQEMKARQTGKAGLLLSVLKANLVPLALLGIWNATSVSAGRPYGWGDWLGFAATAGYAALVAFGVLPALMFDRILHASAWGRWRDMQRYVGWLRRIPSAVKIPAHQLDHYEARALIGLGRVEEGIALYRRYENDASLPRSIFLSQLATLYEGARDFDAAERTLREAKAHEPDNSQATIDLALMLARRGHRVDEAKALLDAAESQEVKPLAAAFLKITHAILAIDEQRYVDAIPLLTESFELLDGVGKNPLVDGMKAILQAHLAMAALGLGRKADAERLWRPILPRVQALDIKDIVGRFGAIAANRPFRGV